MKIVQSKLTCLFRSVKPGQAFGFSGYVYVKCNATVQAGPSLSSNFVRANAVRLSDGSFGDFQDSTFVRLYDRAEVVINEGTE